MAIVNANISCSGNRTDYNMSSSVPLRKGNPSGATIDDWRNDERAVFEWVINSAQNWYGLTDTDEINVSTSGCSFKSPWIDLGVLKTITPATVTYNGKMLQESASAYQRRLAEEKAQQEAAEKAARQEQERLAAEREQERLKAEWTAPIAPIAKPPAEGEQETAVENYRGYAIYKTTSGWYHLYSAEKEWGGESLGLYQTLKEAEAGADGDTTYNMPAVVLPVTQPTPAPTIQANAIIESFVVKQSGYTVYSPALGDCGDVVLPPYNVIVGRWLCIDVTIRALSKGKYRIFLTNVATGSLIDKEPDIFYDELDVDKRATETLWTYVDTAAQINISISVKDDSDRTIISKIITLNAAGTPPLIPGLPPVPEISIPEIPSLFTPSPPTPPTPSPATPPAGCPEGTTRVVKCPKNGKDVTQKCVSGKWVNVDEKACEDDTAQALLYVVSIAVVIVVLAILAGRE
ncbi:MAG: hypothetical protein OIN66_11715 [Candidatus Methanoperedens sp.]|nr:hypothetical protein [Candidatus Methanoperedens sp.]